MKYVDNVLKRDEQKAINTFVRLPGWEYGWKSNIKKDIYAFWHKHYAGHRKTDHTGNVPYDCAEELVKNAPLLGSFWDFLSRKLVGHRLVRCYANGHAYGIDGTVHTDSKAENSFTCVYFPHESWSPNWGGDLVFFNKEETDIIWSVYPKPNRLVIFRGTVPHAARGVSRTCPVLRATLMFKTEWLPQSTKTS